MTAVFNDSLALMPQTVPSAWSATMGRSTRSVWPAARCAAFHRIGETRILAISVVNALGGVFDCDGHIVRGFQNREPASASQ